MGRAAAAKLTSLLLIVVLCEACGAAVSPPVAGPPTPPPPAPTVWPPGAPAAPAPDAWAHPGTALAFPETLGGMTRTETIDYESRQAGLGASVGYRHPGGAWATVYLYTMGHPALPDDLRSDPVVAELRRSVADIESAAAQGAYHDLSLEQVRVGTLGARAGSRAALLVPLTAVFQGRPIVSLLLLTTYRGHFVKVRVSYPLETRSISGRVVSRFIDELGTLVRPRD
ncbi:MAG TPA: hypothetical protein VGQ83_04040 [Polyangia bacterium]|jgi:hypothetical protein